MPQKKGSYKKGERTEKKKVNRRAKSRNRAVSVVSGRGPAASDRVTGGAVMALECALLLVEQMATVQGLDLSRRNARRVS